MSGTPTIENVEIDKFYDHQSVKIYMAEADGRNVDVTSLPMDFRIFLADWATGKSEEALPSLARGKLANYTETIAELRSVIKTLREREARVRVVLQALDGSTKSTADVITASLVAGDLRKALRGDAL